MISSLVFIFGISVAQVEPTIIRIDPVTHRILNIDVVNSKFYVPVRLSNGHQTEIPVINGYLPFVTSQEQNGSVYRLDLDYSQGKAVKYDPNFHKGVIQFVSKRKPVIPELKPVEKKPDPVVNIIQKTMPLRDDNQEIEGLLEKLHGRTSENPKKTRFVKPSDIGVPPKVITPSYE